MHFKANLIFTALLIILGNSTVIGQKTLNVNFVETTPIIDGSISILEWDSLNYASDFIQLQPLKGNPASEKTYVYAGYDSLNLYFAFKCIQKKNPVIANIQNRDGLGATDDAVYFWLDTYNDKRTAYVFAVNPIGTQRDMKISDDGRSENNEWDGEWVSKSQIYDWGWTAEFSIPFKTLKYTSSVGEWGVNFGRIIRNNSELIWWSGEVSDNFRISQGGVLSGLVLPKKTERFRITPYASVRYEDSDITENYNKLILDAGIDIQANITSNLSANATINPDFGSVEGDRVEIDLSGWEINFPEKRLFFQEGNEMFSMRYRPFYSRRIGDINYGAKITGKTGRVAFNVLNVKSVKQDDDNPAAFFTVARAKADLFKSSNIGFIVADKSEFDTNYARTFGIDWVVNPGKQWKITGQFLTGNKGQFNKNSGGFIRVANESNKHHVHLRYSNLGENLKDVVNQTGFMQDDDRHELDADFVYTFWMKKSFIKYINVALKNNVYWSQKGEFKGYKFRDLLKIYLKSKFSYSLYYDNRYLLKTLSDTADNTFNEHFYNYFYEHTFGYNIDASSHAYISYLSGRNFGRKMKSIRAAFSVQPIKRLNVSYTFEYLNFGPDTVAYSGIGRIEKSTILNIITLNYYFTNDLWVKIFGQINDYDDRFYLYGQMGWRFKPPFGALYLIYSGNDYYDLNSDKNINHKTFFIKLTYPIGW